MDEVLILKLDLISGQIGLQYRFWVLGSRFWVLRPGARADANQLSRSLTIQQNLKRSEG